MSEHFQIEHRWWTGAVLFEGQFDTMRLCVEAAAKAGANLCGTDLGDESLDILTMFELVAIERGTGDE